MNAACFLQCFHTVGSVKKSPVPLIHRTGRESNLMDNQLTQVQLKTAVNRKSVVVTFVYTVHVKVLVGFILVTTHTHTYPFNGPFSGTTRVGQYQKGKTNLDFTEARDSEWQWH